MAMKDYIYSIANDTLNGVVSTSRLSQEIKSDVLVIIGEHHIEKFGDVLTIWMNNTLPAGEETALDALVVAHTGEPLEDILPTATVNIDELPAFAAKTRAGKKLYSRTHGKKHSVTTGLSYPNFVIPYDSCLFNEVEIINGEVGDYIDLFILDTATGTVTTIPNYPLNQFGYDVFLVAGFYKRGSNYDAELFKDLQIDMKYYSISDKDIYVNYVLHELKT